MTNKKSSPSLLGIPFRISCIKSGILRLVKLNKPEFTHVNEDLRTSITQKLHFYTTAFNVGVNLLFIQH